MDELVRTVAQRAGLSEEAARKAVTTVLEVLRDRLPAPLAGQIDTALRSGSSSAGGLEGFGGIGGMLPKK